MRQAEAVGGGLLRPGDQDGCNHPNWQVTSSGLGQTVYGMVCADPETSELLDNRDGGRWLWAMEASINAGDQGRWLAILEEGGEPGVPELVAEYVRIRRELKARGVLRADRPLVGELAEYLADREYGVSLQPNLVNAAFDGMRNGLRVQVKARVVRSADARTSWDFREAPQGFDEFLGFLFDPDYRLLRVITLPVAVVQELAVQNRGRWSLRWNQALRRRLPVQQAGIGAVASPASGSRREYNVHEPLDVCNTIAQWAEVAGVTTAAGSGWITVCRSDLLKRLVYGGEAGPSQTPCPVHNGVWSGLHSGWPGDQNPDPKLQA